MTKLLRPKVNVKVLMEPGKLAAAQLRQEKRFLMSIGGWGRTTVRRSMRPLPKKKVLSKDETAGKPPRERTGKLKNSVFFAYDVNRHSVVIGPVNRQSAIERTGIIPRTLELGGSVRIKALKRRGRKKHKPTRDANGRFVAAKVGEVRGGGSEGTKRVTVRPRPFIGPTSVNHPKIMAKFQTDLARFKLRN